MEYGHGAAAVCKEQICSKYFGHFDNSLANETAVTLYCVLLLTLLVPTNHLPNLQGKRKFKYLLTLLNAQLGHLL